MPETRITIVIADDPETETVSIRALGDAFLPAPLEGRTLEEVWGEFGKKLEEFRGRDPKDRGPWGG